MSGADLDGGDCRDDLARPLGDIKPSVLSSVSCQLSSIPVFDSKETGITVDLTILKLSGFSSTMARRFRLSLG
jgi:hypothetical protein